MWVVVWLCGSSTNHTNDQHWVFCIGQNFMTVLWGTPNFCSVLYIISDFRVWFVDCSVTVSPNNCIISSFRPSLCCCCFFSALAAVSVDGRLICVSGDRAGNISFSLVSAENQSLVVAESLTMSNVRPLCADIVPVIAYNHCYFSFLYIYIMS